MVTLKAMNFKLPVRMARGHIANSVNLLIGELQDENGCLKEKDELREG